MTRQDSDLEAGEGYVVAALGRMARQTVVPDVDGRREGHLLAAFDAAARRRSGSRTHWWWMTGLATATAALIVLGLRPGELVRRAPAPPGVPSRQIQAGVGDTSAAGDFVPWPGAIGLPPLESGSLVRVDLPLSMLPSLGLRPPVSRRDAVRADLLVGQDGLTRAVRLVD